MIKIIETKDLDKTPPISLEELKIFLRITHTQEDALLSSIIEAAIELFEIETGYNLRPKLKVIRVTGMISEVTLDDINPKIIEIAASTHFGITKILSNMMYSQKYNIVKFNTDYRDLIITYKIDCDKIMISHLNLLLHVASDLYYNRNGSNGQSKISRSTFLKFKKMRI